MRTDVSLRRFIGYGAVLVAAAQIAIADYIFFRYGHDNGWSIPVGGIQAWLAATVVQVFIIVRILAKYLFPPDRPSGTNPRSLVED
jgi:purine-cytosine permease-like protein